MHHLIFELEISKSKLLRLRFKVRRLDYSFTASSVIFLLLVNMTMSARVRHGMYIRLCTKVDIRNINIEKYRTEDGSLEDSKRSFTCDVSEREILRDHAY